jgi:hypothetical protein
MISILSRMPSFYKENIQYDEPRSLNKTIRKDKYMYDQVRGRESMKNYWNDKKKKSG